MNILLLESYPNIKREYLNYLENNNKIFEIGDDYNNEDIDLIFIRSKIIVDSSLLNKFPNLKYIARVGVGLDKVDLEECKKRNIKVLNTPGANSESVADLVLTGILYFLRNLNKQFNGIEKRFLYMGHNLSSREVGIIGFGNIGKIVYERLKAFGVKKFYIYDPFLGVGDIEKYSYCKKIDDKETLFKNSDIITFHIPLLKTTKNFLGEKDIKLLKKDVILVNTSRGGIINEKELINFLKENKKASFFTDVWEEEPKKPKKDFLDLNNILITPHIGAMTVESEKNMHFFQELNKKL